MKRPKFTIHLNSSLITTKSAWNSALQEIPKIMRDTITTGRAWEVSKSLKVAEWGDFHWLDDSGNAYLIEIRKVETTQES